MLNREKSLLCKRFELVDMGEAHHIPGMSIKRERETKSKFISQRKYFESLLQCSGLENWPQIHWSIASTSKSYQTIKKLWPRTSINKPLDVIHIY